MLSVVANIKKQPSYNKGGSITVPLTSCWTGLDLSVLKIKTKIFCCHTADSKPVKQEVNSTVILPPLLFPVATNDIHTSKNYYQNAKGVRELPLRVTKERESWEDFTQTAWFFYDSFLFCVL
jgi:hypothetical protein